MSGIERTPLITHEQGGARPFWAAPSLVMIGFLYGSMDVAFKILFNLPTPPTAASACLVKTFLGTLVFIPAMVRAYRENDSDNGSKRLWPVALSLAVVNVTSSAAIYTGLVRTDASRAAFLLQLSVVATPVLEQLALRRRQPMIIWVGAAIAVCGIAFLSSPEQVLRHDVTLASLVGDSLVTLGALLWGYYLVITASLPPSVNAGKVQALKYLYSLLLYAAWALLQPISNGYRLIFAPWMDPSAWLIALYGAWIPGAAADVVQQKAQAHVRASEASLLLASEPVWALLLAKPLLGEQFGLSEICGGALIFLSATLASGFWAPDTPSEQRQLDCACSARTAAVKVGVGDKGDCAGTPIVPGSPSTIAD